MNLTLGFPEPAQERIAARRTGLSGAIARFEEWMARPESPVRALRHQPARAGEFAPLPEALAEFQIARRLDDNPWTLADLGHLYAVQGRKADAEKVLAELKERARRRYVSPYFIARVYTGLKEREQAFAWLEKAYEARDESLTWLKVDPVMESLRLDPRFADLLRRLGLPP